MKYGKRKILLILGIVLSAVFLYLALRGVDFSKAVRAFSQTNYLWLIPAVLAVTLDLVLRSLRWRILLGPVKKCKFINIMSSLFIGFFANTILPLRAGEVIRIIMIGEKENISKSATTATIVVERSMDFFTIFLLFSLYVIFFPIVELPYLVSHLWKLGGIILFLLILILYGLMYFRSSTVKVFKKALSKLPEKISKKAGRILNSFILGLDILKNTGHLFLAFFYSLIGWSLSASASFFVARGMGIEQVTLPSTAFILGVVVVGVSIPAAPGFVGTYQYFGILALRILGVSKSKALSFTVLEHLFRLVGLSAGGLFFLAREHISVSQLEKKAQEKQTYEE